MVVNLSAVWIFLVGISNTPNGGTLGWIPTLAFIGNFVFGFFFPIFIRIDEKISSPDKGTD
jgi:hypothetical protein